MDGGHESEMINVCARGSIDDGGTVVVDLASAPGSSLAFCGFEEGFALRSVATSPVKSDDIALLDESTRQIRLTVSAKELSRDGLQRCSPSRVTGHARHGRPAMCLDLEIHVVTTEHSLA